MLKAVGAAVTDPPAITERVRSTTEADVEAEAEAEQIIAMSGTGQR